MGVGLDVCPVHGQQLHTAGRAPPSKIAQVGQVGSAGVAPVAEQEPSDQALDQRAGWEDRRLAALRLGLSTGARARRQNQAIINGIVHRGLLVGFLSSA